MAVPADRQHVLPVSIRHEILSGAMNGLLDRLVFHPPGNGGPSRLLSTCFLAFLFFLGVAHWIAFFDGANFSFRTYDWPEEFIYYSALRQAIEQRVLPYHTTVQLSGTTRFLGNPQILVSPQALLLSRMDAAHFVVLNTLLLYGAEFAGCLLLKRRYRLSLSSFTALFLLFSFNGCITSHLAVGHTIWTG